MLPRLYIKGENFWRLPLINDRTNRKHRSVAQSQSREVRNARLRCGDHPVTRADAAQVKCQRNGGCAGVEEQRRIALRAHERGELSLERLTLRPLPAVDASLGVGCEDSAHRIGARGGVEGAKKVYLIGLFIVIFVSLRSTSCHSTTNPRER